MKILIVLSSIILSNLAQAQSPYQTIYGNDDRQDIHQIESKKILEASRSVAALIWSPKVKPHKDHYEIELKPYAERYGMCEEVRFAKQPSGPFATGFLVGPKHMMTAAHAVVNDKSERFFEELPCEEISIVFDYALKTEADDLSQVSKPNYYQCKKVLQREITWMDKDYALIELDREVKGRKPLQFAPTNEIKPDTPTLTIGHPHGLPMKISGNSQIRSLDKDRFSMNSDVSGGNSGSPVFNAITMKVLGIHVSGEVDFDRSRGCKMPKICKDDECWGSWAYRPPQSFLDSLPQYFSKN